MDLGLSFKRVHWRVLYYFAWLVPTLIASFANYSVSAEANADATWLRYIQIHLFYWLAWGGIGEVAYRFTPQRLSLDWVKLRVLVGGHMLMTVGVVVYFSIYYWAINSWQFSAADTAASFLKLMYFRSARVAFHIMTVVTYLIVLVVCIIIRQYKYARDQEERRVQLELLRQRLETNLSESRLTALTNQIHPHFLFNALNNIASLISGGNTRGAYEGVTLLAGLLRKTFQYVRQQKIFLKDEVELVISMMKIGKLRFDDRLSWNIDMPVELSTVRVPPFLIQPLAENALRHGLEATLNPVHIRINIHAVSEGLAISVSDNGPGATSASNGDGVGLQNLKDRLALMSDGDTGFCTSVPPGGGFCVEIILPIEDDHA